MTPANWLRSLDIVHLGRRPQWDAGEAKALRRIGDELGRIGNDVDQIARALNDTALTGEYPPHEGRAAAGAVQEVRGELRRLTLLHREFRFIGVAGCGAPKRSTGYSRSSSSERRWPETNSAFVHDAGIRGKRLPQCFVEGPALPRKPITKTAAVNCLGKRSNLRNDLNAKRMWERKMAKYTGSVLFPPDLEVGGPRLQEATDSFSIISQGYGSITGLTYTVPAHTDADFDIDLKVLSLTSNDVKNLNDLVKGMLSASNYDKVTDYEKTHASANLSFWGMLGGGGGASYDKTHEEMRGFGLSEENIRTIVGAFSDIARNMSKVDAKIHVKNAANSYAVSGNMIVFTIAGTVSTQNQQYQYRMIANQGIAGSGNKTAPTDNEIVPLN